jgi:hypothetical protein
MFCAAFCSMSCEHQRVAFDDQHRRGTDTTSSAMIFIHSGPRVEQPQDQPQHPGDPASREARERAARHIISCGKPNRALRSAAWVSRK